MTSDFDFTDRGGRVQLAATLRAKADFTPLSFKAQGKSYRFVNVDSDVRVEGASAIVKADGAEARVPLPAQFYTVDGYAPFAAQMMLLRYWKQHGQPRVLQHRSGTPDQRRVHRGARPRGDPDRNERRSARPLRDRWRRLGTRDRVARRTRCAGRGDHARRRPELRSGARGSRAGAGRLRSARDTGPHRRSRGDHPADASAEERHLRDGGRDHRRRHRRSGDPRRRHRRARRAHRGGRSARIGHDSRRHAGRPRGRQDDHPRPVGHAHARHAGRVGAGLPRRRRDHRARHGERVRVHHVAARRDRLETRPRSAHPRGRPDRRRRPERVRRVLRGHAGGSETGGREVSRRRLPADQDLQPRHAADRRGDHRRGAPARHDRHRPHPERHDDRAGRGGRDGSHRASARSAARRDRTR